MHQQAAAVSSMGGGATHLMPASLGCPGMLQKLRRCASAPAGRAGKRGLFDQWRQAAAAAAMLHPLQTLVAHLLQRIQPALPVLLALLSLRKGVRRGGAPSVRSHGDRFRRNGVPIVTHQLIGCEQPIQPLRGIAKVHSARLNSTRAAQRQPGRPKQMMEMSEVAMCAAKPLSCALTVRRHCRMRPGCVRCNLNPSSTGYTACVQQEKHSTVFIHSNCCTQSGACRLHKHGRRKCRRRRGHQRKGLQHTAAQDSGPTSSAPQVVQRLIGISSCSASALLKLAGATKGTLLAPPPHLAHDASSRAGCRRVRRRGRGDSQSDVLTRIRHGHRLLHHKAASRLWSRSRRP